MRKFSRIYIEITNICNLNCHFCHGTKRAKGMMSKEDFSLYLDKIKGYTDLIFLHVMGEPLLHPELSELLKIVEDKGFRVVITTNGTLIEKSADALCKAASLYRVNISLHSFEGNNSDANGNLEKYLSECVKFAKMQKYAKVCFRLWNGGADNKLNDKIHDFLHLQFPNEWIKNRKGYCLGDNVYIEYADRFDWPDSEGEKTGEEVFCYGLRDQLGILQDGTVIPCCLDSEGVLALGNLKEQSLDEILQSERARKIYDGFSQRKAVEDLCKRCKVKQHLN